MVVFAPLNVGLRNSERSSIGSRCRSSRSTNVPSPSAATAKRVSTRVEPHACVFVSISAWVRAKSSVADAISPGRSRRCSTTICASRPRRAASSCQFLPHPFRRPDRLGCRPAGRQRTSRSHDPEAVHAAGNERPRRLDEALFAPLLCLHQLGSSWSGHSSMRRTSPAWRDTSWRVCFVVVYLTLGGAGGRIEPCARAAGWGGGGGGCGACPPGRALSGCLRNQEPC